MIHASDRMGGAVIGASIFAALVLLPFTQDPSYLISAIPLVVLLGALGMVLRRLRVNDGLVFAGQLVLLVVFLFAISLPLAEPGQGLFGLFAEGVRHMSTHTTPMVANPGLTVLLVAAAGLAAVLTDLLTIGVDRPAWGILPALTLYLIGAVGLLRDLPWWTIIMVALGYLWILLADGINSAEQWPRNLDRTLRLTGRITPLALRMGGIVAAAAVALTLLIGQLVPLPPAQHWNAGRLNRDSGPIQLADPLLDMRRNLSLPADSPVLTYTTDAGGQYLRMASLAVFDSNGWQNASFPLTQGDSLPPAPGQTTPGAEFTTQIQIGDFRSEYLPLPYAPRKFDAPGSWAFSADSLVVVATGEDRTAATRDISYEVVSTDPAPDGMVLSTAMAGRPSDGNITAAVPQDMPQEIIDLALEITRAEPSAALKAAAIQRYLRSGEFTYSLEPQPGTGYDAMTRFLFDDRRGYCEQFAGSMAAMSRAVGIPSQVAVGWLPGDQQGDGFEVTMHDMHAWPELYFENVGWVRFEPTPGVAVPPGWTLTAPEEPEASASATPSQQPTESASAVPTPAPTEQAAPEEQQGVNVSAILGRVALAIGVLGLVVALLAVPGLLRRRQRKQRLAPIATEDLEGSRRAVDGAWAEVRDSFLDYGHGWPAGSPRAVGRRAAAVLPEDAGRSLVELSRQVERSRYAQAALHTGDLAGMVGTVREGLQVDAGWDTKLVAEWWPRSWWSALANALAWPSIQARAVQWWQRRRESREA